MVPQNNPMHHSTATFYKFSLNLSRRRPPYRINKNGMGIRTRAMNASSELPHPRPRALNILAPESGRTAPNRDRTTVLAAIAEAAYLWKQSIR